MTTPLPPPDTLRADTQAWIDWYETGMQTLRPVRPIIEVLRGLLSAHPAASSDRAELPCWCDESKPNGRDLCPQHAPAVIAELREALAHASSESVETAERIVREWLDSLPGYKHLDYSTLAAAIAAAITAERRARESEDTELLNALLNEAHDDGTTWCIDHDEVHGWRVALVASGVPITDAFDNPRDALREAIRAARAGDGGGEG